MKSQNERHLRGVEEKIAELAEEAKAVIDKARDEGRERNDEENAEVAERHAALKNLQKDAESLREQIEIDNDILGRVKGQGLEVEEVEEHAKPVQAKSLGEQFTESPQFKQAFENYQNGAQHFSTGGIEMKAGTLLEGAQGAGLIPVPQVIPGQVETLFQRLSVADLLQKGQTNTNSLRYVVEGTATNAAAAVAEGGAKPASNLALSTVDEPVKKIATTLTVSDEMLEDVAQVQSYINGRLSLFVKIQEEASIVSGGGTDDLVGLLGRSIHTYPAGTVDNNAVALFKAINGTRGSSFLEPDAVIMNPANWQTTRLLQDSNNQFYGGGPFTGAYGTGSGISSFGGQLSGQYDSIWGKPVVVTTAVGVGTALLGSFGMAAQLFQKGGVTVEATNSHASNFISNLVTIRAEERLGLAVYRPGAFTKVTGLG